MDGGFNILSIVQLKPIWYLVLFIVIGINILLFLLLGTAIYYLINIGNKHVEQTKKIEIKKKYIFYISMGIIFFILIIVLYQLKPIVIQILKPVFWAIILSYLLNPFVIFFQGKGVNRTISVLIVFLCIIGIIAVFSATITPKIAKEITRLVDVLPRYADEANLIVNNIYTQIEQLDDISPQLSGVKDAIGENIIRIQYYIIKTVRNLTEHTLNMLSQIVGLVLIPIFSFYILKDTQYFKKIILYLLPKRSKERVIAIGKDIDVLLSKFIRGQLIVASFVGGLSTLALLVLKVDFAFLIGLIAGVSNIIPYFGPIIGAIPAIIIAILDEPSKALWVIISFTAIQQIESGILSPKIVGDSVGLHPIIVILSLLVGNEIFGIIGMLFAIPVTASIKIIGKHIFEMITKV